MLRSPKPSLFPIGSLPTLYDFHWLTGFYLSVQAAQDGLSSGDGPAGGQGDALDRNIGRYSRK